MKTLFCERRNIVFKRKEHPVFARFEISFLDPISIATVIKVFTRDGKDYVFIERRVYKYAQEVDGEERKEVLNYIQEHAREILYHTLLHVKALSHDFLEKNVDSLINFSLDITTEEKEKV